ncbi:MAG TPA: M6 family metalloprotease domain-containing protein [Actinophytocola sp.]|uniref:M6 family metalloprotease domain-containing protein n=1 Tax=Actinophytocola sp. TaxID=1872138 RepID=UPI002DDCA76A|nr:M6 family metalloprotease domain-containing protein [Actinophytocola sp.]HEV2783472.1 M6 family metalloprotease domain-containing protein [Actinophytocola sp.]
MRSLLALAAAAVFTWTGIATADVSDGSDVTGPCALPNTGVNLSEGPTNWANFVRPVGRVTVVTIFVDFPDAPATEPTTTDFANLMPGGAQWFTTSSYGRLTLDVTPVHRWFRMPQQSTAYNFQRGLTFSTHRAYILDAVRAADPAVDFRGFQLLHIIPNRAAAAISFSPTFLAPAGSGVSADGREFRQAVTFGQDMWRWGFKVLNHESGHTFSLPDLYSFAGGHPFVGGWDLMGLISGPAPDYLAWHKWKLGWLDEVQLRCVAAPGSAQVTLTPLGTTGGIKAAIVRTSTTVAYVAEVRTRTGLDASACDSGVLIYRVDSAIRSGSGPVQVIDAHPATTVCGSGLNDAAFDLGAGEVAGYTDTTAGVHFELLTRNADGGYTLRATRL